MPLELLRFVKSHPGVLCSRGVGATFLRKRFRRSGVVSAPALVGLPRAARRRTESVPWIAASQCVAGPHLGGPQFRQRSRARIFDAPVIRLHARVGALGDGKSRASPRAILNIIYIMRNSVSGVIRFVGSAWQWLRLWLGSCLPVGSPDKDELAA